MSAAQALAGALARLAELGLLGTIMSDDDPTEEPWVFAYTIGRTQIYWGGDKPTWVNNGEALLQVHIQKEIEARGWSWAAGRNADGRAYAAVLRDHRHVPPVFASAPALALGRALAQAMGEGEG